MTTTTKGIEAHDGFECFACAHLGLIDDVVHEGLYECGSCGTLFRSENSAGGGSNRCPDCNKFAGKVGDLVCPECDEGPCEERTVYAVGDDDETLYADQAEAEKAAAPSA